MCFQLTLQEFLDLFLFLNERENQNKSAFAVKIWQVIYKSFIKENQTIGFSWTHNKRKPYFIQMQCSFYLIYLHLSVLQYMQFMEDYSEPQPSVFYQMPQSESIYEQRNKRFQEVYGFNDSFSSTDSVHEPPQPPALPPKQRQLVRPLNWYCILP